MTEKCCSICHHAEHKPNQCKNCNCGQSEMAGLSEDSFSLPSDYGDYLAHIYSADITFKHRKGDF